MPPEPGSLFGGLLSVCVSDEYDDERKVLAEGVLLVALGAVSSLLTVYALSALGFLL
ncbi:MAG: hypothetical protein JRN44_00365 [Nitrososphaerota archaeon]|nr:hypothetical protein [Nitrososphaerota archaeon]MDG6941867.1 hypothetical protein [Nitrososphaerota archaeon]MDG6946960.1 hypothetical protein [Nitrososphaerota archaeon]MDG6950628.1 hypothetical protein [Nitrososphaerota archaeon]